MMKMTLGPMLLGLFAKISRFPIFENSGFLVETGSFPDGRGGGGWGTHFGPSMQPPLQFPYNYGYTGRYN